MPSHERVIEEIHYSLSKEMRELYWVIAIRNFAIALPGFFIPIYVFLYFERSVAPVMIFYALQAAFQILLVPLSAKLMHSWGLKKMMARGGPFIGVYMLMLLLAHQSEHGMIFITLAVVAQVIYLVLYWPARHVDFARFAREYKSGRQIGTSQIIATLTKLMAPMLGGLIIVNYGFAPVFIIAIVLLGVSTIPLFYSPEVHETFTLSWAGSFKKVLAKVNISSSRSFFFEGIDYAVAICLLPIFIYVVIGEFDTIGWITSAALVFALVTTYFIGYATDKQGSKKILPFASLAHGFSWVIMAFAGSPLQYLVYSGFFRIAETANHLPFISDFYARARKRGHGMDEFIVYHEIAHNFGRVVILTVIAIGFALGLTSFFPYFVIAGISSMVYRILR